MWWHLQLTTTPNSVATFVARNERYGHWHISAGAKILLSVSVSVWPLVTWISSSSSEDVCGSSVLASKYLQFFMNNRINVDPVETNLGNTQGVHRCPCTHYLGVFSGPGMFVSFHVLVPVCMSEGMPWILPLWDCAPASVDLLCAFLPASHGRSCFDSGGRTLSLAGLEEHKGQRCETAARILWKRIMAIDDLLRARQDKSCVQNDWGDFC